MAVIKQFTVQPNLLPNLLTESEKQLLRTYETDTEANTKVKLFIKKYPSGYYWRS